MVGFLTFAVTLLLAYAVFKMVFFTASVMLHIFGPLLIAGLVTYLVVSAFRSRPALGGPRDTPRIGI